MALAMIECLGAVIGATLPAGFRFNVAADAFSCLSISTVKGVPLTSISAIFCSISFTETSYSLPFILNLNFN